ncbi:MAG: septation regulator SpoVG [Huintestinicola sp.]
MTITETKIRSINTTEEGRLRAVVSITIDDCLAIHDIKVIEGDEKLFVAMPSRKDENGMFRDIVHPIDSETRETLEEVILDAYLRYVMTAEAVDAK